MPPKPETVEDIGKDFVGIFGEGIREEELFSEWCKVGLFLSDRKRVLTTLRQLADEILAEVLERDRTSRVEQAPKALKGIFDVVTSLTGAGSNPSELAEAHFDYHNKRVTHYKSARKKRMSPEEYGSLSGKEQGAQQAKMFSAYYRSDEISKKTHGRVLDTCLRRSESAHGFAEGRAIYHGFVNPAAFMQELEEGKQWKDPGALPIHGEHAHRLQWFCIGRDLYSDSPKHTAKVLQSIGASYKKYQYNAVDAVTKEGRPITLTLWDALCDRTCIKQVAFATESFRTFDADPDRFGEDFRSPENLNTILVDYSDQKLTEAENGKGELQLLQLSLLSRFEKRVFYAADGIRIDSREYIAKKKFKAAYQDLETEQAKFVDEMVDEDPPIWSI